MGKRQRNRLRRKGLHKMGDESQSDFQIRIMAENLAAELTEHKLYFDLPDDIKLPTLWEARNTPL